MRQELASRRQETGRAYTCDPTVCGDTKNTCDITRRRPDKTAENDSADATGTELEETGAWS